MYNDHCLTLTNLFSDPEAHQSPHNALGPNIGSWEHFKPMLKHDSGVFGWSVHSEIEIYNLNLAIYFLSIHDLCLYKGQPTNTSVAHRSLQSQLNADRHYTYIANVYFLVEKRTPTGTTGVRYVSLC